MTTTIKEVLEYLHGRGMVLTDLKALQEALDDLGLDFDTTVWEDMPIKENMYMRCPKCNGSDINAGHIDAESFYRNVYCENCEYDWTEYFVFCGNELPEFDEEDKNK
jgi:hypothetical protein